MKQDATPEALGRAGGPARRQRLVLRRPQNTSAPRRARRLAVARALAPSLSVLALAAVALVLRLRGVAWSLPYIDDPEEPAVLGVAISIVSGDLNPGVFSAPSLLYYLHAALLKVHLWLGLASGLYPDATALALSHHGFTTAPQAFIWGRALTAICGSATALALFVQGRRYLGYRAALLGALLLAGSPWAVDQAHYLTLETPATLVATLALLATIPVLVDGTRRDYLGAGLLLGLASACAYRNGLLLGSLVAAHLLGRRGRWLARGGLLLQACALATLVFCMASPSMILDHASFLRDARTLLSAYDGPQGDLAGRWPLSGYLAFLWARGLGPVFAILTLVGAATMAHRRPALCIVLLCFPALLLLALLQGGSHFFRNLLPLQPVLLLLAGYGAVSLWGYVLGHSNLDQEPLSQQGQRPGPSEVGRALPGRRREQLINLTGWLAALALLALTLVPAARVSSAFARPDSRVVAQEWARAHWPGTRIASELVQPLRWNGSARQSSFADYLPLHPPAWYRSQGFALLLASSDTRTGEEWTMDYQLLREATTTVATFGGTSSQLRGPRIDLLDTGLSETDLPESQLLAEVGPLQLRGTALGPMVEKTGRWAREPGDRLRAGQRLGVTTFWRASGPAGSGPYSCFLHLRDTQGRTVAQLDRPFWHGLFPPQSWPRDRLLVDQLELALPQDLAPGSYQLVLGLYDPGTQARYPLTQGGRRLPGDELALGNITIVP